MTSAFNWKQTPCKVTNCCDPIVDTITVTIDSELVRNGPISIFVDFAYCDGWQKFSVPYVGFWDEREKHSIAIIENHSAKVLNHTIGDLSYDVVLNGGEQHTNYHWEM